MGTPFRRPVYMMIEKLNSQKIFLIKIENEWSRELGDEVS